MSDLQRIKKLTLSETEAYLFRSAELLPLKHRICRKMEGWLELVGEAIAEDLKENPKGLPPEWVDSSPRLSRGENYHEQAYRVLDYPRFFAKADMLTARVVVLWGHATGFHLMAAGKYREQYLEAWVPEINRLPAGFQLSAQQNPWIWENTNTELLPVDSLDEATVRSTLESRSFIKLSYFLPLEKSLDLLPTALGVWHTWRRLLTLG